MPDYKIERTIEHTDYENALNFLEEIERKQIFDYNNHSSPRCISGPHTFTGKVDGVDFSVIVGMTGTIIQSDNDKIVEKLEQKINRKLRELDML